MTKSLLVIFSLILSYEINFSQTSYNIVPNPGFQTGPGTPRCRDYSTGNPCWFDQDLDNWKRVLNNPTSTCQNNPCDGTCSSPDWMHTGCPELPDPQPMASDRWVFVGGGEGIQVALLEKLKGGHSYTIRMKLAPTTPDVHLRIHFSQNNWSSATNTKWNDATGFIFPGSNPINPVLWKMCQNNFTVPVISPGTDIFQYLVIVQETGKFEIDDVEILDNGTGGCAQNLLIENYNYGYVELPYEASQYITAGYNVGVPAPDGNVVVKNTADVTYKAGQEVTMKDGFSVDRGGIFHAYIAPCGFDCPYPIANAGPDITVNCSQNCYQIGTFPSQYGSTYLWTANPASAVSYLSNTTIPNPVVCLPPSGYGAITYSVTVTNRCNQTATDAITITPPFYLDISTGVNNGSQIAFGQTDLHWIITKTPSNPSTSQPSFSANPAASAQGGPAWPVSSTVNWITPAVATINNIPGVPLELPQVQAGQYDYTTSFNLSSSQVSNFNFEVKIDEINVDNSVSLLANGNLVLNGINYSQNSMQGPFVISNVPFFQNGLNSFNASTTNINHWTGLLIKGSISGYCKTHGRLINSNEVQQTTLNESTDNLKLFPNPNTGVFSLIIPDNMLGEVHIQIFDFTGRVVYKNDSPTEKNIAISIASNPKGIYFVKTQIGDKVYTEKVVVQ